MVFRERDKLYHIAISPWSVDAYRWNAASRIVRDRSSWLLDNNISSPSRRFKRLTTGGIAARQLDMQACGCIQINLALTASLFACLGTRWRLAAKTSPSLTTSIAADAMRTTDPFVDEPSTQYGHRCSESQQRFTAGVTDYRFIAHRRHVTTMFVNGRCRLRQSPEHFSRTVSAQQCHGVNRWRSARIY